MRWFASVRIPGFGKLSPRVGMIGDRVRVGAAARSAWFWVGFFGVLAVAWWLFANSHQ